MLGTLRVATQLRVPCQWKECRWASRVPGEELRSHLSGFLSLEGIVYAEKIRSAARWRWSINDACNITSDAFLLVTAD